MPVSVRTRLPDSTAWRNMPRQQLGRGAARARRPATPRAPGRGSRSRRRSSSRGRPRPRTGARPRRRRSTCRGGRRTRRGRRPSSSARKSRTSPTAAWKCVQRGVDLGAVARGEQRRPRARCSRAGEIVQRLRRARRRAPSCARAARPARCGGSVRRRSRDTSAAAPLPRRHVPARTSSSDAGIEAPIANRRPRWNAPRPAALPGPRTAASSSVSYSGPSSSASRRRSQAASAGLRPPVPTVTTRSPRRTTDISVKEQLAGSSALFTQTRPRLAGLVAPPR